MKFVLAALLLISSPAWAQKTLAGSGFNGKNNVYLGVIPAADGVGFNVQYEMKTNDVVGYGANVTILPEKFDNATGTARSVGLMAFGGYARFHHDISFFDLYVSPGMNLMMMEIGNLDKTTFGPSLAFGFMAQITNNIAAGLEYTYFHPWFNDDFYVASRAYYQNSAITVRFSF